jgi:hypothetical protein
VWHVAPALCSASAKPRELVYGTVVSAVPCMIREGGKRRAYISENQ